ncbi:MAG: hypothetical protein JW940_01575 [Polyangiaceae bacterium]|nr:hypothetical protein [Polyangiaceae bacterium]
MDRKAKWRALAAELGFEFKEGLRAFFESEVGRRELEERAQRGEIPSADLSFLDNPLFAKLADLIFEGAVVGRHRGIEFTLFPASRGRASGSGATSYSTVSMFFERRYELELVIYNETFVSKLGKILFFQQDIQLGDERLDRLVMIKGKDELAVKRLLDAERVREQLTRMFEESAGYTIRDFGIRHQEAAEVLTRDRAVHLMDQMVALADALPPP